MARQIRKEKKIKHGDVLIYEDIIPSMRKEILMGRE
jgi:hypothetical protein